MLENSYIIIEDLIEIVWVIKYHHFIDIKLENKFWVQDV